MKPWRGGSALPFALTIIAGLTTPWTLTWLLGHLGSLETIIAERTIARSGVHSFYSTVVPCIDALVCAVVFGITLSFVGGRSSFRTWLIFMVSAITAHIVASLFAPAPFGGLATGIWLIIHLPFWWLFAVALLGILALAARAK